MVNSPYDDLAGKYLSAFTSNLDLGEDIAVARIIQKYIPRGPCIDVGCGTAAIAKRLPYHKYHGLDISNKMLNLARITAPDDAVFTEADMCQIPVENGFFPAALSLYGSMCEVPDFSLALSELRRITARDGTILIMLLGTKYRRKKTFLKRQNIDIQTRYRPFDYELANLKRYFTVVEAFGFSCLPNIIKPPSGVHPTTIAEYLTWESRWFGQWCPNQFYYYIFVCKNGGLRHAKTTFRDQCV